MDDQQFKQLLEALKDALSRMGLTDGLDDLADNVSKSNKQMSKQEKLYKYASDKFEKLNKELEKGRKKFIDLGPTIKDLDEALEDVTDNAKKLDLQEKRDLLAKQYLSAQYQKAGKDLTKAISEVLISGIWKSTTTLVRDMQSGSSGIQMAADLMNTALDSNQAGLTAVAKTGETLGAGMTAVGGKTGKFGAALSIGSSALEYFSSAATAAAKEGVNLLAVEAEKTIKAFNSVTAAGALFGKGMDDLRFYSGRAGLTVDQFSNVIDKNSNELARSGYTVAEGAKAVGNVTSRFAVQTGKSGQTLQREMLNLGLGFEEQADLTAKIISDLKRTGGTASNGQVAAATADIAKNMKAVADIMGEEYKGRQEAAKKQAEQYAFQAKVNEIAKRTNDPGLPKRLELAMSQMSDANRRAFVQATVLNGAVTDVAANLTGAADAGRANARALLEGRTSMEELMQGTFDLNEKFQSGTNPMLESISKVTIATGQMAEISEASNQQQQDSYKVTRDNFNRSMADVEKLSGAHGGLQDELMGVETQAQKLKVSIQEQLTPTIEKFGRVANEVLDGVSKAVKAVTSKGSSGGGSGHSFMDALGHIATTAGIGATAGGGIGTVAGALIGGVPTAGLGAPAGAGAGFASGEGIGAILGGLKGLYDTTLGEYADGGIASGPMSGFQTTLHGTEAVVPLPDGNRIPVELKQNTTSGVGDKSIKDMLDELKRGHAMTNANLTDLIRVMKDNNNLTSGILQNSY